LALYIADEQSMSRKWSGVYQKSGELERTLRKTKEREGQWVIEWGAGLQKI